MNALEASNVNAAHGGGRGGRGRGSGRGGGWRGRGAGRGGGGQRGRTDYPEQSSSPRPRPENQQRAPKPPLTHFLALPIGHHAPLRARMSAFTDALLQASPAIPGLDASIVIPPRRLHLTLGVMSLSETDEQATASAREGQTSRSRTLRSAIALLEEIRPAILEMLRGQKLLVPLKSMDVMTPERRDLERAHVMWVGPVQGTSDFDRLKRVSDFVQKTFKHAGLVVDEGRPLKLHCTVLNTIYRRPRSRNRVPFSFSSILTSSALRAISDTTESTGTQTYKYASRETQECAAETVGGRKPGAGPLSVNLGDWVVDEVQICEMGSWGPEGEYVSVGHIAIA